MRAGSALDVEIVNVPSAPTAIVGLGRGHDRANSYDLHLADAFEWMAQREVNSVHAIVTDPPYGLKEFSDIEKEKLRRGQGGVWRIPPSFDGCPRSPLPRFTVLNDVDFKALRVFFRAFAEQAIRILVPGGHVIVASNPLLSHHAFTPLIAVGLKSAEKLCGSYKRSGAAIGPRTRMPYFRVCRSCLDLAGNRGDCCVSLVKGAYRTTCGNGARADSGGSRTTVRFWM